MSHLLGHYAWAKWGTPKPHHRSIHCKQKTNKQKKMQDGRGGQIGCFHCICNIYSPMNETQLYSGFSRMVLAYYSGFLY